MASAVGKQPCIKCDKGGAVATCGGCRKWFCTKHFNEHRQDLATAMENITQEHDLLQRDLNENDPTHSFMSHINDWEQRSIAKIQATAEQARLDLRKYLDDSNQQLKMSLARMTTDLKSLRESEDYTEHELDQWIEQLKEMRTMLEKPSTIRIVDKEDTSAMLQLIRVEQIHATPERSKLLQEEVPLTTSSLQEMQCSPLDHKRSPTSPLAMETKDCTLKKTPSIHICQRCSRAFSIHHNNGGECAHDGTWHAKLEDCSYLKCGFHLGLKASIGRQHWSCCYSLDRKSNTCEGSGPHIFMQQEN